MNMNGQTDPALIDFDFPALMTTLFDTAQVLREDAERIDGETNQARSGVEQCLATLQQRLLETNLDTNMYVLRERCRHAPPPRYLQTLLLASSAFSHCISAYKQPGDPFWEGNGEGMVAMHAVQQNIEETWHPYRSVLDAWLRDEEALIRSVLDQTLHALARFTDFSRNPLGDVEMVYSSLEYSLKTMHVPM